MMVQQHHQPRLFDVRRMPLAVHARRDWLEVLRGALPPLVPPVRPKRGRAPLVELYIVGVARGLLVGAGAGAIAATVLVPFALLFGTVAGAAVGFVVAALPSLLLAGGITVLAAHRHRPLRDPREFHREVWSLVLVGVGVLDLVAVALASLLVAEVPWRLAAVALVALNAVVLGLLRPALRRVVVAYAEASGWLVLDPPPPTKKKVCRPGVGG